MDNLDKRLLTILQAAMPVEARPFDALAAQVGIATEDCLARVRRLVADGTVRRIGPVFDSRRLGYASTLVAASVTPERLVEVADRVSRLPGVTHNYERRHAYNLWFTLAAPSQATLDETLSQLRTETGAEFHSLPALTVYKIRVQFDLAENADAMSPSPLPSPASGRGSNKAPSPYPLPPAGEGERQAPSPYPLPLKRGRGNSNPPLPPAGEGGRRPGEGAVAAPLSDEQKHLVRLVQNGLEVEREPFAAVALRLGWTDAHVIAQIREWMAAGVIRRFGAVVRHQQLGFAANGMSVFRVAAEKVDEAGRRLAAHAEVSHCYRRPPLPDFPYNLFAMTHGRSESDVLSAADAMARESSAEAHDVLFSVREFKKVSMRYFEE